MASLRLIIRTHDHSPIFPKYSHVYPTTYNSTQRLQSVFLTLKTMSSYSLPGLMPIGGYDEIVGGDGDDTI